LSIPGRLRSLIERSYNKDSKRINRIPAGYASGGAGGARGPPRTRLAGDMDIRPRQCSLLQPRTRPNVSGWAVATTGIWRMRAPGACATIIRWILWIQAISYYGKLAIHPTPLIPVYQVPWQMRAGCEDACSGLSQA